MGSEGNQHQENENEDIGRDKNTRKPNVDDESEDNNNEISSIMDKQYGKRTR